jgi:phosphoglycolate phosphatase
MTRPRPQGVIFDLDGTLVDTLADIAAAMNSVLAARSQPVHPPQAYRAMLGLGVRNLVGLALPEALREPTLLEACVAEMMTAYGQRPLAESRPYEGIPELLAEMGRRRIPAAVLSNKPDALTRLIVAELFPTTVFRRVQGERPGVSRKPDPASALALCRVLELGPAQVLFVGDSPVDVATASNAGMPCAAALWGFSDEAELRAAGADLRVVHPEDVAALLRP